MRRCNKTERNINDVKNKRNRAKANRKNQNLNICDFRIQRVTETQRRAEMRDIWSSWGVWDSYFLSKHFL